MAVNLHTFSVKYKEKFILVKQVELLLHYAVLYGQAAVSSDARLQYQCLIIVVLCVHR